MEKKPIVKAYRVRWEVKKNNVITGYAMDVKTINVKEARKLAEGAWYACNKSHMFHIRVDLIPKYLVTENHLFGRCVTEKVIPLYD